MQKNLYSVMLSSLLVVSTSALAADPSGTQPNKTQQPGSAAADQYEPGQTTLADSSEVTRGYIGNEVGGVRPVAGLMAFTDALGNGTSRAAVGMLFDMNAMSAINPDMSFVYFGPQTGLMFSHMGSPSSGFVGTSPSPGNDISGGANALIIPADLKTGYTFEDKYRLSLHAGGNVVYRSVASSAYLGDSSSVSGSVWRIFPNIGLDADLGFSKSVALTVRPDWTLTPGNVLFTGMVGVGISLG